MAELTLADLAAIVAGGVLFVAALVVGKLAIALAPRALQLARAVRARYFTRAAFDLMIERIAALPNDVKDYFIESLEQPQNITSTDPAEATAKKVVPADTTAVVPILVPPIDEAISIITKHNLDNRQLEKVLTLLRKPNGDFALSGNAVFAAVGGNREAVMKRIAATREAAKAPGSKPIALTPVAQRPTNGQFRTEVKV